MSVFSLSFNVNEPTRLDLICSNLLIGPYSNSSGPLDPRISFNLYNDGKPIAINTFFFDSNSNRYVMYTKENLRGDKPIQLIYHIPSDPYTAPASNNFIISAFSLLATVTNAGIPAIFNFASSPNPVAPGSPLTLTWKTQYVPVVRITGGSYDSGYISGSSGVTYIPGGVVSSTTFTISGYDNNNTALTFNSNPVTTTNSVSLTYNLYVSWTLEPSITIPIFTGLYESPRTHYIGGSKVAILATSYGGADAFARYTYEYDVSAHTLVQTASKPQGGTDRFASCVLNNGKILIAGGVNSNDDVGGGSKHSYLYDPSTHTYTTLPDSHYPSAYANRYSMTPMKDGRAFYAISSGTYGGYSEIYDPVGNTWTVTANVPGSGYNNRIAVTLADGRIGSGPGINQGLGFGNNVLYLYNPTNDSWATAGGSMTINTSGMLVMSNGKIFNVSDNGYTSIAYNIYDPTANSWSAPVTVTPPALGSWRVGAPTPIVQLTNGIVAFVLMDSSNTYPDAVYYYDPVGNSVTRGPDMVNKRMNCPLTVATSANKAIAVGASISSGSYTGSTNIEYL